MPIHARYHDDVPSRAGKFDNISISALLVETEVDNRAPCHSVGALFMFLPVPFKQFAYIIRYNFHSFHSFVGNTATRIKGPVWICKDDRLGKIKIIESPREKIRVDKLYRKTNISTTNTFNYYITLVKVLVAETKAVIKYTNSHYKGLFNSVMIFNPTVALHSLCLTCNWLLSVLSAAAPQ